MREEKTHIFSAQKADTLDSKIRRLLQNPLKILTPLITKGMTVLDYGCGNGYFSIPLAKLVGNSGQVYSVDIQQEMLDKLEIKKASLGISNITMINVGNEKLNLPFLLDFAIAVYVVHEIPDKTNFFKDIYDKLKPNGQLLIIEPDFIVSRRNFNKTLEIAKQTGFIENEKLNLLFSKTRILMKEK
jgi:ubiquinone/menaquinone biosynthesis C-methylase UbiE